MDLSNGTQEDIKVQTIGHCDPNDQGARLDIWLFYLDTLHPKGLNQKRTLKYWINRLCILSSIFGLTLLGHTHKEIIALIIMNTNI